MVYDPIDGEPLEGEAPDDKELNQLIDEWLAEDRPERYDAFEKEWMDATVRKVADSLNDRPDRDIVIEDAARRRVYQREGQATRRANKILRLIAETGALPLEWSEGAFRAEVLSLPLSIDQQRVRFGAASPADLENWKTEAERAEVQRHNAQLAAHDGAEILAGMCRTQRVQRVEDVRATKE